MKLKKLLKNIKNLLKIILNMLVKILLMKQDQFIMMKKRKTKGIYGNAIQKRS